MPNNLAERVIQFWETIKVDYSKNKLVPAADTLAEYFMNQALDIEFDGEPIKDSWEDELGE